MNYNDKYDTVYQTNSLTLYLVIFLITYYSTYTLIRTYFFRFSLNGFLCKWCLVEF